ncbi:tRNA (adenosine(37)-N6)-threonylcarbamoyltransferase complex dimerization subunit type 1 TsaB [Microbacterium horticulturae]|uniref:tRNA (Adenosine(37)-N6)-threonylcarbamoyltransferase complex dimerization subunit type 1 TsaB n=1 Tax=Microbacterium horticulturae TaxID=3028316 RepID=A0ABY8BYC8_9MICO|nr:tRNA (adenosine(37)-N6)-threonylcarbamoyltransferase complex dimerization subunit type 1 TsaB [Microbacterium sp. KACC 23027]WEG08122.1 tRNA (adenosine(37)-N6)-threonylcarbamoyltransferase complex dimerization subunit type 1 TsaB [Microbacterium sp. KACC 23027]
MILGIDTSLGTTVAVIEEDGVARAQADSADPLAHAEVIGTLLEQVVGPWHPGPSSVQAASAHKTVERTSNRRRFDVQSPNSYEFDAGAADAGAFDAGAADAGEAAAARAGEITHVAAGMGPGPFTGLRIGIAAARAFALGRGIPVVPVVSHDAIALEMLLLDAMRDAATPRFAVVTDARRREVAYSVYEGLDDDGLPVRSTGPALAPRDEIDAVLAQAGAERRDATAVSGMMLALAAARALAAGREIGPHDALYLRSPDVALPAARKKVGL